MTGQSAVTTLRAYGYEARSDGLGNVQALVWHSDGEPTATRVWVTVPTDPRALLAWLTESAPEGR